MLKENYQPSFVLIVLCFFFSDIEIDLRGFESGKYIKLQNINE